MLEQQPPYYFGLSAELKMELERPAKWKTPRRFFCATHN
jgi:hypothetical protein